MEQLNNVTLFTTDIYGLYMELAEQLFPNAQIVLDRLRIVQLFTGNMTKARIDLTNSYPTNSHRYRGLKRYWNLFLAKDWELNRFSIKSISVTINSQYKSYPRPLEVMQDKELQGMEKFF